MSKKNETVTLLLALVITLIFFGAGSWWLYNRFQGKNNPNNISEIEKISPEQKSVSAQAKFSQGENLLIVEGASSDKQAAIQAIGKGNFQQAVYLLERSLQTNQNDPEALIYLNNARIGEAPTLLYHPTKIITHAKLSQLCPLAFTTLIISNLAMILTNRSWWGPQFDVFSPSDYSRFERWHPLLVESQQTYDFFHLEIQHCLNIDARNNHQNFDK